MASVASVASMANVASMASMASVASVASVAGVANVASVANVARVTLRTEDPARENNTGGLKLRPGRAAATALVHRIRNGLLIAGVARAVKVVEVLTAERFSSPTA